MTDTIGFIIFVLAGIALAICSTNCTDQSEFPPAELCAQQECNSVDACAADMRSACKQEAEAWYHCMDDNGCDEGACVEESWAWSMCGGW